MQEYHYQGWDQQGTKVVGKQLAPSEDALIQSLHALGIIPVAIAAENKRWWSSLFMHWHFHRRRDLRLELRFFCQQMYAMQRAGIPIVNAVMSIAESTKNVFFKKVLVKIAEQLQAGQALSDALSLYAGDVFSDLFIGIIAAGEKSGKLEAAFYELAAHYTAEMTMRRQVKTAFRYPVFVLVAMTIAMMVLCTWVIPTFADLFKQFSLPLPWITRLLLSISDGLRHHFLMLAMIVVMLIAAVVYGYRHPTLRLLWDTWKYRLPIIGQILKSMILARYARIFVILHSSGLPVTKALQLLARALGDTYFKRLIGKMYTAIEKGSLLSMAARASGLFPGLVIQMLKVGEETGEMAHVLKQMADYYAEQATHQFKRLNDYLEPFLVLVLGIMVMLLALGVLLPIWHLTHLAGHF